MNYNMETCPDPMQPCVQNRNDVKIAVEKVSIISKTTIGYEVMIHCSSTNVCLEDICYFLQAVCKIPEASCGQIQTVPGGFIVLVKTLTEVKHIVESLPCMCNLRTFLICDNALKDKIANLQNLGNVKQITNTIEGTEVVVSFFYPLGKKPIGPNTFDDIINRDELTISQLFSNTALLNEKRVLLGLCKPFPQNKNLDYSMSLAQRKSQQNRIPSTIHKSLGSITWIIKSAILVIIFVLVFGLRTRREVALMVLGTLLSLAFATFIGQKLST